MEDRYWFYPFGYARGAACWDFAHLELCVCDLCGNGILIDTVGVDDTLRLSADDAGSDK